MKIIEGYMIKGHDIAAIERITDEMYSTIKGKWTEQYVVLLQDEIAAQADDYVLGVSQREPGHSLLETAQWALDKRIKAAIASGAPTQFNFALAVEIMTDGNDSYFYIASPNSYLTEQIFHKIRKLIPYDVTEGEDPENEVRIKKWNEIRERYKDRKTFRHIYIPELPIEIDTKALTFSKPAKRAMYHADNRVRSRLLSYMSAGENVPPELLMRRMNEIEVALGLEIHQREIKEYARELTAILPVLTEKDVIEPYRPMIVQPGDGPTLNELVNKAGEGENEGKSETDNTDH